MTIWIMSSECIGFLVTNSHIFECKLMDVFRTKLGTKTHLSAKVCVSYYKICYVAFHLVRDERKFAFGFVANRTILLIELRYAV